MLLAARRPDAVRQTLLDGLHYHAADPVYLKPVLTYLLRRQEDAHVVALARRHLSTAAPGGEQARLLALGAATATYFRGNYDQAEDFLRAVPGLATARDGRLLAAKIEWDRGYRELALLEFRALAAALPHDAEVHRELVAHLRQLGRADEARRSSVAFQIAHPQWPGPRITLLTAYRESGDIARVQSEAAALLRDFAGDEGALLALADFAAGAGDVDLVRRLARHAQERGLAPEAFAMLTVETLIVAKDCAAALGAVQGYRAAYPEWEKRHSGLFDSLQAAALLGLREESAAGVYLDKFLGKPNLRADNLLAVANRFTELGAAEHARKALIRAVEVDPLNQAALTRLVEMDVASGAGEDLAAHVQRLVRLRRPSPDILRVAAHKLGSDFFLFTPACQPALAAVQAALAEVGSRAPRH
jgi:Flp pilus assembly protein TadD